jgi:aspartyl-tRNA synthetase
MTELATSLRSDMAGTLRPEDAERAVTLAGWVHRLRDLGHLVFLDLRDRSGLVQVSLDPGWTPAEVLAAARRLGPEDVVRVEGVVHPRVDPNPEMETGAVEVRCDTAPDGRSFPRRSCAFAIAISTCAAPRCSATSCCAII